jgi:hypothetical protein
MRLMPASFFRLKGRLFGPRETVTIESAFYKIQDVPEFNVVRQLGEPGHRETNGFAVWIADDKSLKRLAQLIQANPQNEKIAAPRAVTADGVQSALWVGSSPLINGQIKKVGLDVRMLPVLRPEISDFTMFASFTEVLTNSIGTGESQKMTNPRSAV